MCGEVLGRCGNCESEFQEDEVLRFDEDSYDAFVSGKSCPNCIEEDDDEDNFYYESNPDDIDGYLEDDSSSTLYTDVRFQ